MSVSSFDSTFDSLKRRALAVAGLSGLATALCAVLLVMLIGFGADLIWDLSPASRLAARGLAMIIAVSVLAAFIVRAVRASRNPLLARRLDQTGATGGEIVSGYELQSGVDTRASGPAAGLTRALADMAVAKAQSLAAMIPGPQAISSRPARVAGYAACAAFVVYFLMAVLAPRVAYTEWLRFFDPFGDHPPYSPTHFVVEPGDTQVRYGDPLDITVKVEGPSVDDLELVLQPAGPQASGSEERLPMFFDSAGHWRTTVTSVTNDTRYHVRSRATRSHRFKLDVITVPELQSVKFRITPPEYTRDAVYEGPLPQSGIVALAGTTVEVQAYSNRPLKSGAIEFGSGDKRTEIPLASPGVDSASREVQGTFTISAAGTFDVYVTDIADQRSLEPLSGTITLLDDQKPLVRIIEPPAQSLATPSVTLPVVISAEDDYGVTKLQLFRSLNDSTAMPLSIDLPLPPPRHHEQAVVLPLSEYGLQPGDVIKLFARIEDNDPAGAKGFESSVVVIQIISDEDLERMVRAREGVDMLVSKYQQAERRLEALQEEVELLRKQLEKRDADGALSDAEREQLETLSKRLSEEAQALEQSARQKLSYDLDKALNEELESLAKQVQQAADDVAESAKSSPTAGKAAESLKQVQEQLAREKNELKEEVNKPLEQLAEIYPLLEDQNRFVELTERQRDLAERLASMKDQENPDDPATKSRMRDLEAEQHRNRQDLEQLLNDIESHAKRLPSDDPKLQELAESCQKFCEGVRESQAQQQMEGAEQGLGEFSGKQGHKQADQAATSLEGLLSKCQGNGEACEGACNSLKFKPGQGAMGDTLNQLLSDAGFKPGQGGKPGQSGQMGAGGGYSSRRSEMKNIGMYGNIPTRSNPQSARSGGGKDAPTIGGSYRAETDRVQSSRLDPHGLYKSSGISETAIPSRYRSQVRQYFQTIADEAPRKK
jgi:hypothetical protein